MLIPLFGKDLMPLKETACDLMSLPNEHHLINYQYHLWPGQGLLFITANWCQTSNSSSILPSSRQEQEKEKVIF